MTIFKSSNAQTMRADVEERISALVADLHNLGETVDDLNFRMAMMFKSLDEKLSNSHICTELVLTKGEYKCKECGEIFDKKVNK